MDERLQTGIVFFNRGRYYEAHESWEDVWRDAETPDRSFCQGLVQLAVGLHHWSTGNRAGGSRVLRRGLDNLKPYPDQHWGIDKAGLVGEIQSALDTSNMSAKFEIRPSANHADGSPARTR